jgi:hypothetical protein
MRPVEIGAGGKLGPTRECRVGYGGPGFFNPSRS